MKVGDLIKFKNCSRSGEVGIVIQVNCIIEDGVRDVHCVAYGSNKQMYFTTNQLEVINENR